MRKIILILGIIGLYMGYLSANPQNSEQNQNQEASKFDQELSESNVSFAQGAGRGGRRGGQSSRVHSHGGDRKHGHDHDKNWQGRGRGRGSWNTRGKTGYSSYGGYYGGGSYGGVYGGGYAYPAVEEVPAVQPEYQPVIRRGGYGYEGIG